MKKDFEKKIRKIMINKPGFPISKGELWLGTDFLKQAGFDDTLENHFLMAEELGHDMVCFPVTDGKLDKPDLGYRYFYLREIKPVFKRSNLFVSVVIDGPFQELVNQMGLMEVLTQWARDRQKIFSAYELIKKNVLELIAKSLTTGVQAVVITDDLASDHGPFINPKDIDRLCTPFYSQAVDIIHKADCYAFLHSCGKITQLATLFKSWEIDGIAAIQHGPNNFVKLWKELGSNMVIMGGIDAEMLGCDTPTLEAQKEFQHILDFAASTGSLILSSSCGLYNGEFLNRIKKIYTIADREIFKGITPKET